MESWHIDETPQIITGGNWGSRGLSIWMILLRLASQNHFSAREVMRYFGTDEVQERSTMRVAERDLRTCEGLDLAKIAATINLSPEDLSWSFYDHYLSDKLSRGSSLLRYCPCCITQGIHTPLHQIPAFLECPWHEIPLSNVCPECGCVQTYEIVTEMFREPFTCSCGHIFWPGKDHRLWKDPLTDTQKNDMADFVDWLSPIRSAHASSTDLPMVVFQNEHCVTRFDDCLFELNRLYPGPKWLHRVLGDPVTRDSLDPSRIRLRRKVAIRTDLAASRRSHRIDLTTYQMDPCHTFFVEQVLERARICVADLKAKIERHFISRHADCISNVIVAQGQLCGITRASEPCHWACGYAMWQACHSTLFDRSPVKVFYPEEYEISSDHLSLYTKWHYLLDLLGQEHADNRVEPESLPVLIEVFIKWLQIDLFQSFFESAILAKRLTCPYLGQVKVGEAIESLLTAERPYCREPIKLMTRETASLSITLQVTCRYDSRAAMRLARRGCSVMFDADTTFSKERGYTFKFMAGER